MKAIGRILIFVLPVVAAFILFARGSFGRNSLGESHSLAADASRTYARECVLCHGRDGRGRTRKGRRTHARDLTEASWQDDVSDERLFNSINNGRGKMPAFRKSLSESEIDALVSHVRSLRR